jgi:hypothetical protein
LRRWAAFNAVCDYLRAGLVGGASSGADREAAWEDLVALSSEHFVTPALAWCVRQDRSLPHDVREYLDAVLRFNSERNALLLVTLKRVATLLNAIDIEPVVLKGATELITGSYPAAGMRVIGDLDLLIPIDRAQSAAAALKKAGFAPVGPPLPPNHHHLPVLADPETAAGVELHMTVVHNRSEALMPRTWFMETTIPSMLDDAHIRLLDATRSVAHTIVHDQLDHVGYARNRFELRRLLDVVVLRSKQESSIDWSVLDRRFCDANLGRVLATFLKFAEVLFRQTAPQLATKPRGCVVERLCAVVEQPRRAKRRALHRTLLEDNRAMRAELERLRAQLGRVYDSTSWKLSAPVRVVGTLLRKIHAR